ncbi:MAG TPA: hypothetical protein VE954_12625 [Oligoflexus sp.]|uniref:hypothetical protein n=1 Tax=Oligoflexus sp. TaxID=1971216 RepID=UPI002D3C87AE|nr:hypothetical protein [Oligoflexus sp.]HYX33952.1 hypothetical protein [Oligoflexus sp.]
MRYFSRLPEDMTIAALLGYFFSLRPQEIIAVKPSDFLAGNLDRKRSGMDGLVATKPGLEKGLSRGLTYPMKEPTVRRWRGQPLTQTSVISVFSCRDPAVEIERLSLLDIKTHEDCK